jgi:hypothetical protein
MNTLAELVEKLKRHRELVWNELPGGVRIEPPNPGGFAVEVHANESEWTVFLGNAGFHEAFETGGEALQFVAWCYSGEARLREIWRGGSPSWSALEAREGDAWRRESETRLVFVPFWRKRREVVLENPNLLKPI